jgi:uncharacterized protein YxjI
MSSASAILKVEKTSSEKVTLDHPLKSVFGHRAYKIQQPYFQFTEEGYEVSSEDGSETFKAKRPRKIFRSMISGIVGFFAFATTFFLFILCGGLLIKALGLEQALGGIVISFSSVILGISAGFFAAVMLAKLVSPKRRLDLFPKSSVDRPILTITPTSGMFIFNHEYSLNDVDGNHLASFKKNFTESFFRKKWHAFDAQNNYLFSAVEDSLVLALLRRYVGLGRLIPLHFKLQKKSGKPFGHFKRRFSLRDKYDLQYQHDLVEGWLIVAAALLLDTGEER